MLETGVMDIKVFAPEELPVALGAVRAIDPYPTLDQDRFLRAIARLHGAAIDPQTLPVPTPDATARAIRDPRARQRILELAVVMALIDGQVFPVPTANVSVLARALDVGERETRVLRELAARHHLMTRIDFTRRIGGRLTGEAWREERWNGVRKMFAPVFNVGEDRETAARYQALARLPANSFGFALWEYYRSNDFAFPGETGGIPERGVFHDLGHILSGYGTDPEGEIQQAAFQAGFVRNDGFLSLYFGIVQFHLGVRLAPLSKAETGFLDIDKITAALARGAACRVDLSDRWDFWPLLPKPLARVREELGVPPAEPPHSRPHLAA
ncbi:MAG TPA: hypothetical protein VGK73_14050 [Polyangiaceae bacterium]